MKLPKKVKEAFEEFDAAAQGHGYATSEETPVYAAKAKARYDVAKDALFKALNSMRRNERRRAKEG